MPTKTESYTYALYPGAAIREIRLVGSILEYVFDSWVYDRRLNRRLCDFNNAVKAIKSTGVVSIDSQGV
jgi:hypothetical protein